eukprot:GDKH01006949.1.p1 GENE.GDKH01006949.1~~GDKH01006949.1.p1  ORF type:complete len:53 (-),score=6.30 GDKH01006949.1:50-208(-)
MGGSIASSLHARLPSGRRTPQPAFGYWRGVFRVEIATQVPSCAKISMLEVGL